MEVPFICQTETHLLLTITVSGIPSAYEIVKSDG